MSKIKRTVTVDNRTITTEFNSVEELIEFLEWEQSSKKQDKPKCIPINKETLDKINDMFKIKPQPLTPQWDQRVTYTCPTMDILWTDRFMAQEKLGLVECNFHV